MTFEPPKLQLRYGSGTEASEEGRKRKGDDRANVEIPGYAELIANYPDFEGATCVFVAGSLVLGWGHATSDLDLYVVTEDQITISPGLEAFDRHVATSDPLIHIVIGELGPYRIDTEVWRASQIDEIIAGFTGRTPDQEKVEPGRTEQDMLYRLATGRPLRGESWWAQRRDAINASSYGLWLAEQRKLIAEGYLEDVVGLLPAKDFETALYCAHEAFTLSVEAVLAVHGDYTVNRKWLYRRLQTFTPPEIGLDAAWDTFTMIGARDDMAGWAERTAQTAQRLLLAVEAKDA